MNPTPLLESKGLTSVSGKTYPGTFSFADSGNFTADQLANRDSASWKKAEHIILKECSKIIPATLLMQWRKLTADGKHTQFLYRPVGDEKYEKYDSKGVLVSVGELKDLIVHSQKQIDDTKGDRLTAALKVFRGGRSEWKGEDGWATFDEWAKTAREKFASVDESWIDDPTFDYADFMRKFSISHTVANTTFAKHSRAEQVAVLKFLREERERPHAVEWHLDKKNRLSVDGHDVPGMLPTSVCFFMMKLHPTTFAAYSRMTYASCAAVGLYTAAVPATCENMTPEEYVRCRAMQDRILARMDEMDIGKASDDASAADYITANEFIWFVSKYEKEIEREALKMKLQEANSADKRPGKRTWADVLSGEPDELMNRLVAALLTKPFAILAGASGTGKSRMVRKLAYMTCLNAQLQPDPKTKKPIENFCMVAVKPNWHDSTDLLGYRSAVSSAHKYVSTDFVRFVLKAHAFPDTPFFVCLDEMNLAPVEHYFAEFLSASETMREEADGEFVTDPIVGPGEFDGDLANLDPSGYAVPSERKALIERIGLYLPKNLFVVGTVNMDDSTSAFSRKVVDRAMTLVMDDVNYADLQKTSKFDLFDRVGKDGKLEAEGVLLAEEQIAAFVKRRGFRPESLQSPLVERLTALKEILHQTPLAIGYRFARECVQYRDAVRMLMAEKDGVDYDGFALDHLILMKVLPRLVGNRDDHADLLNRLKDFFKGLNEQKLGDHEHALSASALKRMEQAAEHNGGYLSFYP